MEDNQLQKNQPFVREKIKEKPISKKRAFVRLLVSALCGMMFAGMACLVFALLLPRLHTYTEGLYAKDTQQSETASQEDDSTEIGSPVLSTESETASTETGETSTEQELPADSKPQDDGQADDKNADDGNPDGADLDGQDSDSKTELPDTVLTLEAYQKLQEELYGIGTQANASVVTITSVRSDKDLFNNSYEAEDSGSGVIIMENDEEYLILTERKVIKDASRISVTFWDEAVCDAALKKEDKNTGLAVLSVNKSEVGEPKAVATISSAMMVHGGMIAIALGSPLGTNYSILTGNITSTNNTISVEDSNYTVYTTDIVADKDGSGVLINVDGEIIGIVMQDYSASRAENTLTAICAQELWPVIEKLCAGEDIPYLGMKVSTVTSKIEGTYGIPKGVYVKEVVMDSPAMSAGIQSGDVITSINGQKVSSDAAYSSALLELKPENTVDIEIKRKGASDYATITCEVTVGTLQ
ncbi:MAG: S1C family serine protease [Agathobacter sp.]|nr:S1C family serine protease [Agathobacter sp.]